MTKGTQPSIAEGDPEAISEWMDIMARTVDLDGIADDGVGYNVTISGPTRTRSRLRRKTRSKTASISQRKGNMRDASDDAPIGLEIPMETEVTVCESKRAVPFMERYSNWSSVTGGSENMTFENVEFGHGQEGLQYLGDASFLNPTLEEPTVVQTEESNVKDGNSVKSLEVVPIVPTK
jgi:hypothetical protein